MNSWLSGMVSLSKWKFSMRGDLCFAITAILLDTMSRNIGGYTRKQQMKRMIVGKNLFWPKLHPLNKHDNIMMWGFNFGHWRYLDMGSGSYYLYNYYYSEGYRSFSLYNTGYYYSDKFSSNCIFNNDFYYLDGADYYCIFNNGYYSDGRSRSQSIFVVQLF